MTITEDDVAAYRARHGGGGNLPYRVPSKSKRIFDVTILSEEVPNLADLGIASQNDVIDTGATILMITENSD